MLSVSRSLERCRHSCHTFWIPFPWNSQVLRINPIPRNGNLTDVIKQVLDQNLQAGHLFSHYHQSHLVQVVSLSSRTGSKGSQALAMTMLNTLPKLDEATIWIPGLDDSMSLINETQVPNAP